MKLCDFKMFVSKDIFDKYHTFLNSVEKEQSSDDD